MLFFPDDPFILPRIWEWFIFILQQHTKDITLAHAQFFWFLNASGNAEENFLSAIWFTD